MSWNGSNNSSAIPLAATPKSNKRKTVWIFVAVIIAILISYSLVHLFENDSIDSPAVANPVTKSPIPSAKLAESHHRTLPRSVWKSETDPGITAKIEPPSITTRGLIDLGALPENCIHEKPIFHRQTDAMIAGILTAVPGDHFLCNSFDDNFDELFKESLSEPIEIKPDDSSENVELKNAVIGVREILKKAMDRGEKPSEILSAAQEDIEKITAYRDKLEAAMNLYLEEKNADDAAQFCEDANNLLKEYNARPLSISPKKLRRIREYNGQSTQEVNE